MARCEIIVVHGPAAVFTLDAIQAPGVYPGDQKWSCPRCLQGGPHSIATVYHGSPSKVKAGFQPLLQNFYLFRDTGGFLNSRGREHHMDGKIDLSTQHEKVWAEPSGRMHCATISGGEEWDVEVPISLVEVNEAQNHPTKRLIEPLHQTISRRVISRGPGTSDT